MEKIRKMEGMGMGKRFLAMLLSAALVVAGIGPIESRAAEEIGENTGEESGAESAGASADMENLYASASKADVSGTEDVDAEKSEEEADTQDSGDGAAQDAADMEPETEPDAADVSGREIIDTTAAQMLEAASVEETPIANGTSGDNDNIQWELDAAGKLTVSGTGNLSINSIPWNDYKTQILSATIEVQDMTRADSLFSGCTNLKEVNLENFDTSSVTNMAYMFSGCSSLESLDLSSFDTSSVTTMAYMFSGCSSLESLDLSKFQTNQVTTMAGMFGGCSSLKSLDLSSFVTSNVTSMWYMFRNCSSLESLNVNNWDVKNVTGMGNMFYGCSSLITLDLSSFVTSNVTDMVNMFNGCTALKELNVDNFDTKNVTKMEEMFYHCYRLESLDISSFDTSSVTTMDQMFSGCLDLKSLNLGSFETSKVTTMSSMFLNCISLESLDLSGCDFQSCTGVQSMFNGCSGLESLKLDNVTNTTNITSMSNMFDGCSSLKSLDLSSFDTSGVTIMDSMFNGCSSLSSLKLGSFNTSSVTSMSNMFNGCSSLTSLDVSSFDTGKVRDMMAMFYGCSSLTSLEVGNFNTEKVVYMNFMFQECSSLKSLDLSSFDTSAVEDMPYMFDGCSSLENIDVSSFDTKSVTDMTNMFNDCSSLKDLDISGFDTSNVTGMYYMFYNCSSLEDLDVSGFDTSNVTNMYDIFYGCSSLKSLNLSGFNFENCTVDSKMLWSCSRLATLYTPIALSSSIDLPTEESTDVWYDADGNQYTELPKNLAKSILLKKNEIPTEQDPYITVSAAKTVYEYGAGVSSNDLIVTYYDKDGMPRKLSTEEYQTNLSGIDMSELGNKTITVTYEDSARTLTAALEIAVALTLNEGNIAVTLPEKSYVYDGTAKEPIPAAVSATVGEKTVPLTQGKDYQVSYKDNVNAGKAFICIEGIGNYRGTLTCSFMIEKAGAPAAEKTALYEISGETGRSLNLSGYFAGYGNAEYSVQSVEEDAAVAGSVLKVVSVEADGILSYSTEEAGSLGDFAVITLSAAFANYESSTLEITIILVEERVVYTVSFDLSGHGETISALTGIKAGSLIEEPENPQDVDGYSFDGWYKDAACTKAWNFGSDTVQENVTLYAGWVCYSEDSLRVQEITSVTYTGKALKPAVRVYSPDGETLLKANKDYSIQYYNNVDADTDLTVSVDGDGAEGCDKLLPYVAVVGKGSYAGLVSYENFHILPADLADVTMSITEQLASSSTKAQKVINALKYNKMTLISGTDYTAELKAEEGAGSETTEDRAEIPINGSGIYTLTIKGKGNYSGTVEKDIYVADNNHLMKNAVISIGSGIKKAKYNGGAAVILPSGMKDAKDVFTVKFKVGGKYVFLDENEDYTVSYTDNKAVGTAVLTVTGMGEYYGSKSATFQITGTALNANKVKIEGVTSQTYTGKALTQNGAAITVKSTEKLLEYGRDYMISYKNNIKVGTATMTFKMLPASGYTGSFTKTFRITARPLTDAGVTIGDNNSLTAAYDPDGAQPELAISYHGMELKKGTDYTVTYADNKKLGQAKLTIKGKGNYSGKIENVPFTVTAMDINDAQVSIKDVTYTGASQKPTVTVKYKKKTMKEGTDYSLSYDTNSTTDAGTVLVTITGIDGGGSLCKGERTERFTIKPVSIDKLTLTGAVANCTYNVSGQTVLPSLDGVTVKVKVGGKATELTKDKDYTVRFLDTADAGNGKILFAGRGNYTGMYVKTYKILPADISAAEATLLLDGVALADDTAPYTGQAIMPTAKVELGGKTLEAGTDYSISYKNNKKKGSATVTIQGKGNYTGKKTLHFTIGDTKRVSLAGATVTLVDAPYEYTGSGIEPEITVTLNKGTVSLDPETDYTVTYSNNINKGTGSSVTVTGRGDYVGTVKKNFTIKARALNELEDDNITISGLENIVYNGTAQKPEISVTVKMPGTEEASLALDASDYKVEYSGNKKASTDTAKAKVKITGKGNYSGSVTREFTIEELDLSSAIAEASDLVYSTKSLKAKTTLSVNDGNGIQITIPTGDYEIEDPIDYKRSSGLQNAVTIKAKGSNTKGSTTTNSFYIGTSLKNAKVSLQTSAVGYEADKAGGEEGITLDDYQVAVTLNGKIVPTDCYKISFRNNKAAGQGTLVITGIGAKGYVGSVTKKFTIQQKALTADGITVSGPEQQTYTGGKLMPEITVKDGVTTLKSGIDYTVKYTNNIKIGEASVTITGKKNYKGKLTRTFEIVLP